VIIACAAALAFIVLYNLNNINITERIREIATVKVLGFYKNETASYVFRENKVLTVFGCALGLFLGKALHLYVMHKVDIDLMSFDIHIKTASYLLSILLTFVFTWVLNRIMSFKLDTINMAESLKSVD
ncbi:MAG: ABC transporter permease, partial [Lachnospiraceae bacterium]|nr:ABC transporter permease [Lachnospiraceae bacterium]